MNQEIPSAVLCSACGGQSNQLVLCLGCDFWVCPECRRGSFCIECLDNDDIRNEDDVQKFLP